MESRIELKLYIPEEYKPEIFELFLTTLKDFESNKTSFNNYSEFEKCIQIAEEDSPQTILNFWEKLVIAIKTNLNLTISTKGEWNACVSQSIFSKHIFAALIQSLLNQFQFEKDLNKCTKRLQEALNVNFVDYFTKLDLKGFDIRLKNDWAIFRSLFCYYDLNHKRYLPSTVLLQTINMNLNAFTESFFSVILSLQNPSHKMNLVFFLVRLGMR